MKTRLMVAVLLAMCLMLTCASAQTLPDLTTFSPGLTRVSERLGHGERTEMTAELSVRDMLYARDVSLLQAMLSGTQLAYSGGGTLCEGGDTLTLTRGGKTVFSAGLVRSGQSVELTVNGRTFGLDLVDGGWAELAAAGDALTGMALLSRVPLLSVCEAVEGLAAGGCAGGRLCRCVAVCGGANPLRRRNAPDEDPGFRQHGPRGGGAVDGLRLPAPARRQSAQGYG